MKIVDGLDIGWGGTQRWATSQMPLSDEGLHLDFACGYGTFLAQLGWRFPSLRLVGLNIDFSGPHSSIHSLLDHAGVQASLSRADARTMPFANCVFDTASCFLGLQDIQIGFSMSGVRAALAEAVRVLRNDGMLTLVDNYLLPQYDELLRGLPVNIIHTGTCALDVRWSRQVAERAIPFFADGWVAQIRSSDSSHRRKTYIKVFSEMHAKMERQLATQGYYEPFEPVGLVIVQKVP
jgi:SAM-dependent methyltransferase